MSIGTSPRAVGRRVLTPAGEYFCAHGSGALLAFYLAGAEVLSLG